MSQLVERARSFATNAHQRIDQRRKYSNQPYESHLEAVARIVASVTDDEQMIAAVLSRRNVNRFTVRQGGDQR